MKKKYYNWWLGVVFLALNSLFIACTEEVDTTSRYVFKENTILDYLKKHPDTYSQYVQLLYQVSMSPISQTSVAQILSARGNFTCFAPTNDAVQTYLDSLYNTQGFDITLTPDSTAEFIVNNCLIDHENSPALLSTEFMEGTIETQSFAGRFVSKKRSPEGSGMTAAVTM